MAVLTFAKATRYQLKARVGLVGPSGSGKTYTSLLLAKGLGGKVAVIDTENRSASKYAGEAEMPEFDVLELVEFSPQTYVQAIHAAEDAGYDVLIIDSLSHAWIGKGGALEQVDRAAARYRENKFMAWRDVTPHHNALVDALVRCRCHLIVTMRAKTEYVIEKDEKGKMVPRKIGIEPVQRDGLEYEFDVVGDMDLDNRLVVSKSRCKPLTKAVVDAPGVNVAETLKAWLSAGAPPASNGNGDSGNGATQPDGLSAGSAPGGNGGNVVSPDEAKIILKQWAVDELGFGTTRKASEVLAAAVGAGSLPVYADVAQHDPLYRACLASHALAQGWIEVWPAGAPQPAPDEAQLKLEAHRGLLWEEAQRIGTGFVNPGQMVGYLLDKQIRWEDPANWEACLAAFRDRK